MNKQAKEQNTASYMIVSASNRQYAIPAPQVQEILQGVKIYELPFVPAYIEGVINCRGTPYTVINPIKLFEKEDVAIDSTVFLIIKRADDQFCFHITTAETLFQVQQKNKPKTTLFWKNNEIAILNIDTIEQQLLQDLAL